MKRRGPTFGSLSSFPGCATGTRHAMPFRRCATAPQRGSQGGEFVTAHHPSRSRYNAAAWREEQISTMRKYTWLLAAFALGIAAYAVHGLTVDDLAIPYNWWGGRGYTHTRLLH